MKYVRAGKFRGNSGGGCGTNRTISHLVPSEVSLRIAGAEELYQEKAKDLWIRQRVVLSYFFIGKQMIPPRGPFMASRKSAMNDEPKHRVETLLHVSEIRCFLCKNREGPFL